MARSSDSNFLLSLFRDKTFQAKEIRRVISLSALYLAVTTILVGVFYHQLLSSLLEGSAPLLFVSEDIALLNETVPSMNVILSKWMLAMLAINTVITVAVAVYIVRKLGHPILAIKRALREIGNGNLDVRLRKSDRSEFGEISDELTAAMHTIRKHIDTAKQSMEQATELRDQENVTQQNGNTLNELDTVLINCRGALDFFQVDGEKGDLSLTDDNYRSANN